MKTIPITRCKEQTLHLFSDFCHCTASRLKLFYVLDAYLFIYGEGGYFRLNTIIALYTMTFITLSHV